MIVKVRAPTNIAFLKYWGKSDEKTQWPSNDSLSMSLDLYTETLAHTNKFSRASPDFYRFDSEQELSDSPLFLHKALRHLQFLKNTFGFDQTLYLQSRNEFPAGCGIASSASSMASLTLAALAAWTQSSSFAELEEKGFDRQRLASLARLGSGSACRSLWGGFVHWERGESAEEQKLQPLFLEQKWNLRDCIVILSAEEKTVSSTEGHRYAHTSPLFVPRLGRLKQRLQIFKEAIDNQDLDRLGPILEEEALEMHEVMGSSQPPCLYRTPQTFECISLLAKARVEQKLSMYFTLDAGPNVHVLYEDKDRERVLELLQAYTVLDAGVSQGPTLEVCDV